MFQSVRLFLHHIWDWSVHALIKSDWAVLILCMKFCSALGVVDSWNAKFRLCKYCFTFFSPDFHAMALVRQLEMLKCIWMDRLAYSDPGPLDPGEGFVIRAMKEHKKSTARRHYTSAFSVILRMLQIWISIDPWQIFTRILCRNDKSMFDLWSKIRVGRRQTPPLRDTSPRYVCSYVRKVT